MSDPELDRLHAADAGLRSTIAQLRAELRQAREGCVQLRASWVAARAEVKRLTEEVARLRDSPATNYDRARRAEAALARVRAGSSRPGPGMTERVEEIRRQAATILAPWCVYECDPPRALWVGGASKEQHYTTTEFLTVCTACQLIDPVSAALAQAERERDEAPVNRDTWSVEPLPGPVPYKVWMPNAAVDQWRELIAARAEVERLKEEYDTEARGRVEQEQITLAWQAEARKAEADLARVRAALEWIKWYADARTEHRVPLQTVLQDIWTSATQALERAALEGRDEETGPLD